MFTDFILPVFSSLSYLASCTMWTIASRARMSWEVSSADCHKPETKSFFASNRCATTRVNIWAKNTNSFHHLEKKRRERRSNHAKTFLLCFFLTKKCYCSSDYARRFWIKGGLEILVYINDRKGAGGGGLKTMLKKRHLFLQIEN